MAYILGVNPSVLAEGGMPTSAVFFSTAIASGIACIVMGLVAKFPVGLAPGMGLNALFTYTIILEMGNSWESALAAVFILIVKEYSDLFKVGATSNCLLICHTILDCMLAQSLRLIILLCGLFSLETALLVTIMWVA